MSDRTSIEWTDATWNTIGGCTRVDEGCRNCYAEVMAARFNGPGQWGEGLAQIVTAGGVKDHRWTGQVRFNDKALNAPLRWKRPRRIFVNSTADTFHESVPDEWIDRIFAVMALCPQHQFQVLTKRPERARAYFQETTGWRARVANLLNDLKPSPLWNGNVYQGWQDLHGRPDGLPNVWLGTSISDQASADARIPQLLACPAAVRFISAEPLLGPVDLTDLSRPMGAGTHHYSALECDVDVEDDADFHGACLNWVIVGGESGPGARPMHPDWALSLRDQCQAASVAFFFKQWGEFEADQIGPEDARSTRHAPAHVIFRKVGKSRAGRLLDGREWNDMPGVP